MSSEASASTHAQDLSTSETIVDMKLDVLDSPVDYGSTCESEPDDHLKPLPHIPGLPRLSNEIPRTTRPQSQYGTQRTNPVRRESTLDPDAGSPSFIPPKHENRTLVLCFDGTGDQFDADNSNIVQLVGLLKKDDRREQMVYYQVWIQICDRGANVADGK